MKSIVFVDSEVGLDGKLLDIGAVKEGARFHSGSKSQFRSLFPVRNIYAVIIFWNMT